MSSDAILERFRLGYGKDIDLTLRPAYHDLLAKLGDPQNHLPPVFHVAGTNGKGSTCAFLRAILESAGYSIHVYTSPHLVSFHERIRIAGKLIEECELTEILTACESYALPGGVSYFEASTAAAFVAFARTKADFTILETGLGGRLDATNVVENPLATLITRLSYDHREYLGDTIEQIAREKAGIMRQGVPSFVSAQKSQAALQTLRNAAASLGAPLYLEGEDWKIESFGKGFRWTSLKGLERSYDLPSPALLGSHQYQNAGLALAALGVLKCSLPLSTLARAMQEVSWPARLQRLTQGRLASLVPDNAELWLDGGHNDSAGEVLALQIDRWRQEDGANIKPLFIVLGMLTTKNPAEFLAPFAKHVAQLRGVAIPHEPLSFTALALSDEARKLGIEAKASANIREAIEGLGNKGDARILICGSLYLAGHVLALNA